MEKINNPFIGRTDGFVSPGTKFDPIESNDIVEYEIIDVVKKVGEKETDFVIEKKCIERSRINRADYINSHSDEVGILNILKKVQLTGDVSLLNQRGVSTGFVDVSNVSSYKEDVIKEIEKGYDEYSKLDESIKGKLSMEEFVKSFGQKEFDDYIQSKIDEKIAQSTIKESEVK